MYSTLMPEPAVAGVRCSTTQNRPGVQRPNLSQLQGPCPWGRHPRVAAEGPCLIPPRFCSISGTVGYDSSPLPPPEWRVWLFPAGFGASHTGNTGTRHPEKTACSNTSAVASDAWRCRPQASTPGTCRVPSVSPWTSVSPRCPLGHPCPWRQHHPSQSGDGSSRPNTSAWLRMSRVLLRDSVTAVTASRRR